jgi:hypothetical protein
MTKFNPGKVRTARGRGPILTDPVPATPAHQGGPGYLRDGSSAGCAQVPTCAPNPWSRPPRPSTPGSRPARDNRPLVAAACDRADEPGELLAYWLARYGPALPLPVKRGLADAALRPYAGYLDSSFGAVRQFP